MTVKDDEWRKGLDGEPTVVGGLEKEPGLVLHILSVSIGGRSYLLLRDWMVEQERYTEAAYFVPVRQRGDVAELLRNAVPRA